MKRLFLAIAIVSVTSLSAFAGGPDKGCKSKDCTCTGSCKDEKCTMKCCNGDKKAATCTKDGKCTKAGCTNSKTTTPSTTK